MHDFRMDWLTKLLRGVLVLGLMAGAGYFIAASWHWPLLCDSPVLHSVNFMMDHGLQPYRDITDNNFPVTYLVEGAAMRLFGAGDLGWRLFDFFLLTLMTLAMVEITRRKDWLAGVFAGGFFLLLYGSQGPNFSVEREQVVTALFLLGYVFLFASVRRLWPALLLPYGIAAGAAASMKPTFSLMALALLVLGCAVLYRRAVLVKPYLLWGSAGFAVVAAINAGFLAWHHAFRQFWFVLRVVTPAYVALGQPGYGELLREALPHAVLGLVLVVGVPLAIVNRGWDWERWALLLGAGFGLLSYVVQRKGFLHHKYMFEALILLLLGFELMQGLARRGWPRMLAYAGVLVTLVVFVPHYVQKIHAIPGRSGLTDALEGDLEAMGGQQLQGRVQCFDLVFGCLNALYHLRLEENTGFTGDLLLFFPESGSGSRYYREKFWKAASHDPADVLVVTNEWFQRPNSFDKLNAWPEFKQYLDARYALRITRSFPEESLSFPQRYAGDAAAYRIYVRKESALSRLTER